MAAPKGHPKWGNPLKPKKYTPTQLWEIAQEYFTWCDKNPIYTVEQSKMPQRLPSNYNKAIHGTIKNFTQQIVKLPQPRAYSIEGFCTFADMDKVTFYNYESDDYNKDDKTYFNVCLRVRQIIDDQHFTGGMAGTFNANIVTRKLGLADKNIQTLNIEQPLFPDVSEDNGS